MTTAGLVFRMRDATFFALSASTTCVVISTPQRFLMSFFIAFGFPIVREERCIFVNTLAFIAHLCAVTLPTPPAPMIRTVLIWKIYNLTAYIQALPQENQAPECLSAAKVRPRRIRRPFAWRRLF